MRGARVNATWENSFLKSMLRIQDWTLNETKAHAKVHTERFPTANLSRAWQGQMLVLFSMEPASQFPIVQTAKDEGYDAAMTTSPFSEVQLFYLQCDHPKAFAKPVDFQRKRKDVLASAFVSNCDRTTHDRTRLFETLLQIIPVHSYGSCRWERVL